MDLPLPTFSFTIPSVHNGNQLECRLYLPPAFQNIHSAAAWPTRGAIVAHPYAPLGGCYDDPVVSFVGSELLQSDCIVGTFNFRGAGNSEGRTSWTAKPELGDYISFYTFMLQYLHHLKSALCQSDQADSSKPNKTDGSESPDVSLILGGYSYGSLIASHVPSPEVILDLFRPGPTLTAPASKHKPTPKSEIGKASIRIATSTLEKLQMTHSHGIADTKPALTTSISYLLVSPLLPPVSHLLTSFSTLSLNVKTDTGSDIRIPCCPADQQSTNHTLALFGDQDTFISAEKLERWSDEMAHMPRSQFQFRKIDGAGHFWREDGVEKRARHALKVWLGQI